MLEKLAGALDRVVSEREKTLRAVRSANAILREPSPPGFDHAASGRAIAQARVNDLLAGTAEADGVAAEFDRQRKAADEAHAQHARRHTEARRQLEQAESMLAALTAQAVELDRSLRKELIGIGASEEAAAAKALNEAIEGYITAFVDFRAVIWLQHVGEPGERGRQFSFPREDDITLAVPDACRSDVPEGWQQTADSGVVLWDRYGIARRVNERVTEIMSLSTAGLYPKVGADLVRQQDS